MVEIFKYHYYNLLRFNIATYNLPPEYLGMIFTMGVFTAIFIGTISETPILFEQIRIMNFNKLALFYFISPLVIDLFTYKSYDPNYQYLRVLYPFKLKKIIFIDFLIEFFSYKLILLCYLALAYVPFCLYYKIEVFEIHSFYLGITLIILMYINSCLLIRIIKDSLKNKELNVYKNYFKLFSVVTFIILVINDNTNYMSLNSYETIYKLLVSGIFLLFVLILFIFLINLKDDKF